MSIAGKFDEWNAALTFASPDELTGVLEINIQAASVGTGSGLKNGKLKCKDFFDVQRNPVITFKSGDRSLQEPDADLGDRDLLVPK